MSAIVSELFTNYANYANFFGWKNKEKFTAKSDLDHF